MKLGHEHKSNKEIFLFLSKLLNANRVYSFSFAMKSIEYYPTERLLPKGREQCDFVFTQALIRIKTRAYVT
jgi:hypothetical protein